MPVAGDQISSSSAAEKLLLIFSNVFWKKAPQLRVDLVLFSSGSFAAKGSEAGRSGSCASLRSGAGRYGVSSSRAGARLSAAASPSRLNAPYSDSGTPGCWGRFFGSSAVRGVCAVALSSSPTAVA